jgi:hypothetical protein
MIRTSSYYHRIYTMVQKHGKEQTGDTEGGIVDMLSNLFHICDEEGLDFADCERQARAHYQSEIEPSSISEMLHAAPWSPTGDAR